MSEKVLKFVQRANEVIPEIPTDVLLAIWEEIDDPDQEPSVEDPAPTSKHKFLKGRNANTQCKKKVKGGGEYCSKHKK